ncbi:MAG TPA: WYL domain-containing protein [Microbacteriaceae bacterium]|nr:WYL domain-containing protein [Microbacteriaceae bacterium]
MAITVRAEERLFSLVLALLATESGLTKSQIFATVRGFEPESNGGASVESLERKFERDKNDLRELGIPLETIESPDAPGDNQHLRYRIPRDEYVFPADVSFSPAEVALLNLAGDVWREGTVSTISQRALTKIRGFDIEPDAPILGYVPRLRTRELVFDAFNQAIEANERLQFDYVKPGEPAASSRDVTPFALGLVEGRWHLLGWDHDRDAERTFLLSRVTGKVRPSGKTPLLAPSDARERLVAGLRELAERSRAIIDVRRHSVSAAQLVNRAGTRVEDETTHWLRLDIPVLDEFITAEELAGCGPELRVLAPESLRERVRGILIASQNEHGGAA